MANARALGEVQARGLRAAGEIVERFISAVDERSSSGEAREAGLGEHDALSTPAGQLLEVWVDLLRRTAESLVSPGSVLPPSSGQRREVEVDVVTGRSTGPLRLLLDIDGAAESPREVWLHNGTSNAVTGISLRCTPPLSPDGAALAGEVAFDPARVDELPARSSRGIAVRVASTGPLMPGTYRSLVQATGAPEVWLPLEVVVQEPHA